MTETFVSELTARVTAALLTREGSQQHGDEIKHRCLAHAEQSASASFNVMKGVWKCHACSAKGGIKKVAALLEIDVPKAKARARRDRYRVIALYDYVDENGRLVFQVERREPKDFRQRRPDGDGWTYDLNGVRRVVYRLPQVLAAIANGDPIFIVEGEKDADRLAVAGFCGTCNAMGAGKWSGDYNATFGGADVVILPDNDEAGRAHAAMVASALVPVARSVRLIELPGLLQKGDVSDWLAAGHSVGDLLDLMTTVSPVQRAAPQTLANVVATFTRWLHLPNLTALYALLATIVANRMPGDPVWLLIVGPPGSGKTELLAATSRLPHMYAVGTVTEAALLSGSSKRDTAKDAKGGLLREIGEFGFIICKDFTSILAMHRDARASTLAALREIYDGQWTRRVGADGGKELSWQGKVGLIAGCTPTVDSHHGVIAAMGERFVFVRLPETDADAQGRCALDHAGQEGTMRTELADAVAGLFAGIEIPDAFPALAGEDINRLVALASLAVRCRSAVERDNYRREIELVPQPEAPARLALILARLWTGLRVLDVPVADAWEVVVQCALDSMPQLRRGVFELLLGTDAPLSTTVIAQRTGYPSVTARRACEDLTAHGVVDRQAGGEGKSDLWRLSAWARKQHARATRSVSETSDAAQNGGTEAAETVSETSTDTDSASVPQNLFNFSYSAKDDKTEKVLFLDDARDSDVG